MDYNVYALVNDNEDKIYYGISEDVNERYKRHIMNINNKSKGGLLYEYLRENGKDSLKLKVLYTNISEDEAMTHERLLVDVAKRFGISLNMHAGGQRPLKMNDDMKLKSREKNKITRLDPEYKKLMSEHAKESMIKNPELFKKFLDSNNNYKESLKKKVIDIDSREIWNSALECSEFLKCHHTTVEKACKKLNRVKKCKGRNLMYYNDFLKIEGRDE